jgi:hypothetical protein
VSAETPGQAAYETGPLGWIGYGTLPGRPWGQLSPDDRAWWGRVGRAAIETIRAELAAVTAARDEYRDNAILHIRERDEARALLADQADNKAELARLRQQITTTTETAYAWRDERDRLLSETARLTTLLARVLGTFTRGSDGYRARVSQIIFIRWKQDAGQETTEEEKRMAGA